MDLYVITALLLTLTAFFSWVNYKFLRLPSSIGLMLVSLLLSLVILSLGSIWPSLPLVVRTVELVRSVDFNRTLMVGMLSFLLFAGSLQLDINRLLKQKWRILSFATFGVLASTFMVGTLIFHILGLFDYSMPYIYCLLFGAIVSPTDPIAVLGILRKAGAPVSLETKITGESLFNDGVGVVVYIAILGVIEGGQSGGHGSSLEGIAVLFATEALGGFLFGLALGYAGYRVLKGVDDYQVELLITLALVTGGYALAIKFHMSGPIAMVVAGLMIGNHGRWFAMSERTRERLDMFWEFIDEVLNSVLFVLIGLELLVVSMSARNVLMGLIAVPVGLLSRFVSLGIPVAVLSHFKQFTPGALKVMTWGGLRGGISVALALSLPQSPERGLILTMTYIVVVFSILVQGLTVKYLLRPGKVFGWF